MAQKFAPPAPAPISSRTRPPEPRPRAAPTGSPLSTFFTFNLLSFLTISLHKISICFQVDLVCSFRRPGRSQGIAGSNPGLSAIQSAIFALSAGKSKILRTFTHYSLPEGTGDGHILSSSAESSSILSVENRVGALYAIVTIGTVAGNGVGGLLPKRTDRPPDQRFGFRSVAERVNESGEEQDRDHPFRVHENRTRRDGGEHECEPQAQA
jgi:hypothetical protein